MTVIPFTPNNISAFQFQPTLDGVVYTATVTWNVSGQRWYLNLYTVGGVLVFCRALIASPDGVTGINLAFGYFLASTLVFRDSMQSFEVSP